MWPFPLFHNLILGLNVWLVSVPYLFCISRFARFYACLIDSYLISFVANRDTYYRFTLLVLILRLRDVTPSHITSLDITPSEGRTLEVLTFEHYTFGQFLLKNITPYEVIPSDVSPSDVSPSGHYTFGTLQLRKITPWWNFPKMKPPKVKHSEGATSRRWNLRSFNPLTVGRWNA